MDVFLDSAFGNVLSVWFGVVSVGLTVEMADGLCGGIYNSEIKGDRRSLVH